MWSSRLRAVVPLCLGGHGLERVRWTCLHRLLMGSNPESWAVTTPAVTASSVLVVVVAAAFNRIAYVVDQSATRRRAGRS